MLLGEVDAEQLLDDGAESDAGESGEARGELGVEQALRVEADLAEAGEVLARGVQDPLFVLDHVVELGEAADGGRVEQEGAGAATEDLDEVGALRVAVAGGALGVDRDRARRRRRSPRRPRGTRRGLDDLDGSVRRLRRRWLGVAESSAGASVGGSLPTTCSAC